MFKRRQPFFVNLGIVWNSNDKKNQVIQDPCYKYGVTLYTCRINRQNLKLNLYKNNTTDICAIYIHHTDKLCRWLAFQLGVYTTWYLLYSTLFGESIKLTKHCWFLASIQTFHKYSDCISLCLPILSRVNCWSDKFIIAIISNSSHVSRFLCL